MKRKLTRILSTVAVGAVVFCAACATMTEEEREAREYARIEWRQQFVVDRAYCNERGGRLEFDGSTRQDRYGIPKHRVYYVCVRPTYASVRR